MNPERYDSFHVGDKVSCIICATAISPMCRAPTFFGKCTLPVVRLADQRAFSGLEMLFTRKY
jgi:hypothetical protein